jgi:hypothetical protein
MTPAQLREALARAAAEADPGYIPPERPPSVLARINNAAARAAAAPPAPARLCGGGHGGVEGACPQCRREADPAQAAARIIAEIQAERAAERDRRWQERQRRGAASTLFLGGGGGFVPSKNGGRPASGPAGADRRAGLYRIRMREPLMLRRDSVPSSLSTSYRSSPQTLAIVPLQTWRPSNVKTSTEASSVIAIPLSVSLGGAFVLIAPS